MSRGGRRREVMAEHSPPPLCVVRMRAPPLSCLCALDALRLSSPSRSRGDVYFANPGCLLAAQSLWATEWRSQVVTGPVRGAANGAAFTVGVAADRRPSAPPPQPFLVVCVGVVCRWGCLWGCSNPLTLSVCRVI